MTFIFKTISNRKAKDSFEFWKNDVLLKENSLYSLSNSLLDFAYGETNSLFFENADYANAPEIQKKVLDFISCFLNSDNNENYYFQFINSSYYYEEFFRPRTLKFKIVENESYISVAEIFETEYIADYIYFVCIKLLSEGVKLNKCGNCGKYFSPQKRSDTLYCNRPSPQDNSMSCKEYGAKKLWYEKLKDNESVKLYRNIYSAKLMLSKTNPNIQEYKENFEKYKIDAKQWLKDVKTGIKTEKEFIIWLKSVRGKRYLD